MRILINLLLLLPSAAFVLTCPPRTSAFIMPKRVCNVFNMPSLSAIIFDWEDSDDGDAEEDATQSAKPKATVYEFSYSSYNNGGGGGGSELYTSASSDTSYDPYVSTTSLQAVEDINAVIADHISHDRQRVGSLARLAAAFAPSDQPLDIQRLDRVGVHAVDERHVEIEAVMCDQSDCTSVLVPVTFPHECKVSANNGGSTSDTESTKSVEACVIENLEELDEQATTTLDLMEELNSPTLQCPNWWVSSQSLGNLELAQEALTIQRLLNGEEFANDVRNLVCRALGIDINQSYLIGRTRVADIGPAGFCFKAVAAAGTGGKEHVVEASLAFDGEARIEANSLRTAVLVAVEESARP